MGYHISKIEKGKLGEFSKIEEEFQEAKDAIAQDNPIMVLLELSDMLGAIEQYCVQKHNITLKQVFNMKKATERAFEDGTRTKSENQ